MLWELITQTTFVGGLGHTGPHPFITMIMFITMYRTTTCAILKDGQINWWPLHKWMYVHVSWVCPWRLKIPIEIYYHCVKHLGQFGLHETRRSIDPLSIVLIFSSSFNLKQIKLGKSNAASCQLKASTIWSCWIEIMYMFHCISCGEVRLRCLVYIRAWRQMFV